jgi:hypothetical protein
MSEAIHVDYVEGFKTAQTLYRRTETDHRIRYKSNYVDKGTVSHIPPK